MIRRSFEIVGEVQSDIKVASITETNDIVLTQDDDQIYISPSMLDDLLYAMDHVLPEDDEDE
jgi:hypothetical protein